MNLPEFERSDKRVTVNGMVLKVKDAEVSTGKTKQNVVIADETGKASLIL